MDYTNVRLENSCLTISENCGDFIYYWEKLRNINSLAKGGKTKKKKKM